MSRDLEQLGLGDVGRGDELVAGRHVALPRVVLKKPADRPTLGMEDGQSGPDLLGEAEQVQLGAELAVVAPLGLLQLVQVRGQRLLGLPGRPVDPLQLGPLLVAPPVGAGHPHQLEVAQPAGRRHMRAAAQVDEGVGVPVGADHRTAGIHLVGPRLHRLDDLLLEGLVGEEGQALAERVLVAHERLVLGHDGPHLLFDPPQIVVTEAGPVGQLEVVVEAVLDHRADGVLGAGPQAQHGLGQHMGGRVAQHGPTGLGRVGDHRHLGPVGQRRAQVHLAAVDGGHHGRLGQVAPDGPGELGPRRALGELPHRAVGKPYRDDASHVQPFLFCRWISPRRTQCPKGTGRRTGGRAPRGTATASLERVETWDAIRARRNVRSYSDRAIEPEHLDRVLEAGRRSPSASNRQKWDFIVVTDRTQLLELSTVWVGAGHLAGAQAAIVLVLPEPEAERYVTIDQYDLGQATMAMLLAATDLGIGSGHSAVGDQEACRRILGTPADRTCAYMIALGYPADRPLAPIANPDRRPFDEVVHRGRW